MIPGHAPNESWIATDHSSYFIDPLDRCRVLIWLSSIRDIAADQDTVEMLESISFPKLLEISENGMSQGRIKIIFADLRESRLEVNIRKVNEGERS